MNIENKFISIFFIFYCSFTTAIKLQLKSVSSIGVQSQLNALITHQIKKFDSNYNDNPRRGSSNVNFNLIALKKYCNSTWEFQF